MIYYRLCREISFKFRTKLPHGLLVYHSVKDRPESLNPYALYVIVEKGQLKVVHVFGKQSTSLIVGRGLNRDEWHSVLVRIDVHGAKLIARVDDKQAETTLKVLERIVNYGVSEELASVVLIGGEQSLLPLPSNGNLFASILLYFRFDRTEFRGTIAWSEVHNRILRRLHQRYGSKFRKIRQRLAAHSTTNRDQARECQGRVYR